MAARRARTAALAPVERRTVGDDGSPIEANARSLGLPPGSLEPTLRADPGCLAIRHRARPHRAVGLLVCGRRAPRGGSSRCIPVDRLLERNHAYLTALGADPGAARDRLRRLPATRPPADPGRVHDRHGRGGRAPAAAPGRRGRHGSSRPTRSAASATSSSCSTRAAMPSTQRPFGPGRRSSSGPLEDSAFLEGDRGCPRLGRHRARLAAALARRGRRAARGASSIGTGR